MHFLPPRDHGVLGINARNLHYLRPFNPRKAVAFADDKLKTKLFLEARGIPVPKLYAKITGREELREFRFEELPNACVLKPNFGYGGEGIIVLLRREKQGFVTAAGTYVASQELAEHCEDIIDGMYSLNHRWDIAFFEQILFPASCFTPLSPAGLPDIRIVVFNLVPVMAMLRIPTAESGGKANLHLGGVGLGIDLAKGVTTFGVQRNHRIAKLPNGRDVAGFKIPQWDEMLLIASRIQQITNIGFLGVDLTLDEEHGPMLLEVNARAGLNVQIANLAPLGRRLERIEGLKVSSPEKGVRIAQDLFGEKIGPRRGGRGERPILATSESIEIVGGKRPVVVSAVLRPDHDRTVFAPSLLHELENLDAVEQIDDGTYRVKFVLGGQKLQTVVDALDPEEEGIRASIGRRDLGGFLVDPAKLSLLRIAPVVADLARVDKQLADIDRKLQLLKHVRPMNLEEEQARAQANASYNPRFLYGELAFDGADLLDRLRYLEADASPLGILLQHKREELVAKIHLLEARGDHARFTQCSTILFGTTANALVRQARTMIQQWKLERGASPLPEEERSAEEVQAIFEHILDAYGLRAWRVRVQSGLVADCSIGDKVVILRQGARFSQSRIASLIAHEIETHVLTAENGEKQPYELFERGFGGYLETQEGLAVWNQNRVLPPGDEKRVWPALGYLAVHYALDHSFTALRTYIRRLGFSEERALRTALKVKRGTGDTALPGAFTKGLVYLRGFLLVQEYLERGGDFRELYRGKVNLRDIALLRSIPDLLPPLHLPMKKTSPAPDSAGT